MNPAVRAKDRPRGWRLPISLTLATVAFQLHATIYYVATNGNDGAAGISINTPWNTIGKAANTMVAGDTVFIRGGTYRETVTPVRSGSSSSPITYQAYPGEAPVISGADVETNWTWDTSDVPNAWKLPWTLSLPSSMTNNSSNPYVSGLADPTILRREMVIFDGQVLRPVGMRADLTNGSFWVEGPDTNPAAIYALFPGGASPLGHKVEAATRSHALVAMGKSYLVINGLTFRHACNAVHDLMVQVGGNGATGVVFENNTVDWANAGGLSVGGSYITCSNNLVQNNGQLGFAVSGDHLLFDHNKSLGNNWKDYYAESWEAGGGKWVYTTASVIRFQEAGSNLGPGIWLDTNNRGNLIENCTVYSNRLFGIFLELNSTGNTVQNNVVFGTQFSPTYPWRYGGGIGITDSTSNNIVYNTVCDCAGNGLFIQADDRVAEASGDNHLFNNIVAFNSTGGSGDFGDGYQICLNGQDLAEALSNTHDGNLFWQGSAPGAIFGLKGYSGTSDLSAWRSWTGGDSNSVVADPLLENSAEAAGFHLTSSSPARGLGVAPPVPVSDDYDGDFRPSIGADAGADQYVPTNITTTPGWTDLRLHYAFDEGTGPALDSGIAPADDGAFVGLATHTTNTPWGTGRALDLSDGNNDWVTAGNPAKLNGLTNFTLTTWFNLRGDPANGDRLIDKVSGTPNGGFGWRIISPTSGTISASNFTLALQITLAQQTTLPVNIGADHQWIFLAVSYDGTGASSNVKWYKGDLNNGVSLLATTSRDSGPVIDTTNDLRIGSTPATTSDRTPPAWFDDVRVFSTVLSQIDLEKIRLETVPFIGLPTITQQPQDASATAGSNVSFIVGASGVGTLSYQWLLDGGDLRGAVSDLYTVSNALPDPSGASHGYSVVVSNLYGATNSRTASLSFFNPFLTNSTPFRLHGSNADSGSSFVLSWPALAGGVYQLEAKSSLTESNWAPVGRPVVGQGAKLVVTDAVPSDASGRYYRVYGY
ncbi:MAG: right-handed parallel beta-helix repeat-containing protein [Verrucomicrobiota bacterium]|nr:right-handed parallel beta-helix repeat-containing protein [Verrucomicrobiota bacterium]